MKGIRKRQEEEEDEMMKSNCAYTFGLREGEEGEEGARGERKKSVGEAKKRWRKTEGAEMKKYSLWKR